MNQLFQHIVLSYLVCSSKSDTEDRLSAELRVDGERSEGVVKESARPGPWTSRLSSLLLLFGLLSRSRLWSPLKSVVPLIFTGPTKQVCLIKWCFILTTCLISSLWEMWAVSDFHYGKIHSRDNNVNTDPGPQNSFCVFRRYLMYIRAL